MLKLFNVYALESHYMNKWKMTMLSLDLYKSVEYSTGNTLSKKILFCVYILLAG
jgi:hypothetical protein